MRAEAKRSYAAHRNGSTRFAIGLLLAALALLALAPSASASVTTRYPATATFGSDGTALTSFGNPSDLAFNQAADKLYVLDSNPAKVHAFDTPALALPGGNFPLAVSTGSDSMAVDNTVSPSPSAGNIYLVDSLTASQLFGFKADGTPLGGNFPLSLPPFPSSNQCGMGVDSAGVIYVGDGANHLIRKFDAAGNSLGTIATNATESPCQVAFDSNGDLFFKTSGSGAVGVYKYTAASGYSSASSTKIVGYPSGFSVQGIAVDATAHTLYVGEHAKVFAFNATTGAFLYDFAGGIAGADFQGVTVDEGTDTVYLSDSGNDKVYAFPPAQTFGDASARLNAATSITDSAATIGATITDNNALPTNWRLELSADGGQSWNTVASGKTAGGQSGLAVSKALSGLNPNTSYRFRAVTNKGTDPAGEVTSSSLSFRTVAPPPVISDVGAINIADTSARLVATIDPRNTDTGYLFEYGTTPALGSSTAPLAIGGGIVPITVSQVVSGLDKDTTYYFRAVATNLTGTTTSPSQSFHTRAAPLPDPENRGFEQVTPPDKNFGDANSGLAINMAGASLDGNAVGFASANLFGEPPSRMGGAAAPYISRRTPSGWQTPNDFPDYCHVDPVSGEVTGVLSVYPSADFSGLVFSVSESEGCPVAPLDPAAPLLPGLFSNNLYFQDPGASGYQLLNTQGSPDTVGESEPTQQFFLGGSEDFSHVVYQTNVNQTAEPDSPPPGYFRKIYVWEQEGVGGCTTSGGCLTNIAKDAANQPFDTPFALPVLSSSGGGTTNSGAAISSDGERIYFNGPLTKIDRDKSPWLDCQNKGGCPGLELYMREGGALTHEVSASECTTACGSPQTSPDAFLSATPSGRVAFFVSCAKLTDESHAADCESPLQRGSGGGGRGVGGSQLYRWAEDAAPGHHLIDLSVDREPADGTSSFRWLIGHSDDGETAYFAAAGQIVAGEPSGPGEKLYRWRFNDGAPTVDYLGPYQSLESRGTGGQGYRGDESDMNSGGQRRQVSADGRYLMLYSELRLNRAADADADADIYRWDEAGGWACISCQRPGAPSGGDVDISDVLLVHDEALPSVIASVEQTIHMSADGQRIFFGTPDALLPEDTNGEAGCPLDASISKYAGDTYSCEDVYEWHDGTLSLVSSGTATDPARLIGADSSGENVFFYTRQRLVGWDKDDGTDIYDARIGGGFPEPPAQPPICEGESCRGAGSAAPSVPGAGSAAFQGPGDVREQTQRRCPRGKRRVTRGGRSRCVPRKQRRGNRAAKHNRGAKR
jgi:hypothetical protein